MCRTVHANLKVEFKEDLNHLQLKKIHKVITIKIVIKHFILNWVFHK